MEKQCRDYMDRAGVDVDNFENLVAVAMHGYEELTGYGDSLMPQSIIYDFHRCLNKDFNRYAVFQHDQFFESHLPFKTLSPLFEEPEKQALGKFNLCSPEKVITKEREF